MTDNASNWVVTQTVTTAAYKGYYKNSSGVLVSFDSGGTYGPNPDTLSPSVVQQTAGQTTSPVTFTGQGFGTNQPTVIASGGTITITPYGTITDGMFNATVVVPPNTPAETVTVIVTSTGYSQSGGSGFFGGGGGQSPTSPPSTATATVQVPTSLKLVKAPPTILQQGNNNATNGCPLGSYGIEIDVDYQVLDQNGAPIANANMEPQENIPGLTNGYQDIGPSRISTTSKFTRADGTFDDAPVGKCPPLPVTALTSFATQSIQILLNGTAYPVRTNSYSYSTTNLPNHGTVTNGKDINATQ